MPGGAVKRHQAASKNPARALADDAVIAVNGQPGVMSNAASVELNGTQAPWPAPPAHALTW